MSAIRYIVLYEGVRVATATAGQFSGPEIALYGVSYEGPIGRDFRGLLQGAEPLAGHHLSLRFAEDDRAPILALTGKVGRDAAELILYRRSAVPAAHVCPLADDAPPPCHRPLAALGRAGQVLYICQVCGAQGWIDYEEPGDTEARIQILADALRGIAADTAVPLSMSADGFEADYTYKSAAGAQAAARNLAAHADAQWAAVQAAAKAALARAGEGAP
jgi:hypothetical protein